MSIDSWKAAWGIFMADPIPFGAAILVLLGVVWWLRAFLSSERIATLEERLKLAADQQQRWSHFLRQATKVDSPDAEDDPP
jgi:hypothetical protein